MLKLALPQKKPPLPLSLIDNVTKQSITMLHHILTRHMLTYDSSLEKKIKNWTIKNKLDLVGFSPRGVNCILLKKNNNNKIRKKDAITRSLPL